MDYELKMQLDQIQAEIGRIRQLLGEKLHPRQEQALNDIFGALEDEPEEDTEEPKPKKRPLTTKE